MRNRTWGPSTRTIETVETVDEQGMAKLRMPPDITPGQHKVVVVIDETMKPRAPLVFSSHDVGPWPEGLTVRREEFMVTSGADMNPEYARPQFSSPRHRPPRVIL
jgi:hypothetical protein